MTSASLSIGVAGTLGTDAIAQIAVAVERAGFHALWVNDTPGGDSLSALAAAAAATRTLVLATGVIPMDRRPASSIVAAVQGLPQERVVLGIGSGGAGVGALDLVHRAVGVLREQTAVRVLVGALGPKMRALAAAEANGPLLSWLTPDAASVQTNEARAESADTHVALYVRAALDDAASDRLRQETERYASFPRYAANFARLRIDAAHTVLDAESSADGIPRYRDAVDEVVLRAITVADDPAHYVSFVEQAAAHLR